jgi:elongation factor Ts
MSDVSAALVKELREKSGAGMMDCKKALQETKGDLEQAVDWLRKKGLASASKKADRVAAEGAIVLCSKNHHTACLVEVNSETDFVARNIDFQKFSHQVASICAHDKLDAEALANNSSISHDLNTLIATIGENIKIRRAQVVEVSSGVVASYMNAAIAPNLGKIGVLVALKSTGNAEKLMELGKKIAMHIAAANPLSLDIASVDPALLEREKSILVDQAKASNRPDDVIQKMVEGRVRKFYEEIVLLEQTYIMDNKTKISKVLEEAAADIGAPVSIESFVKLTLGEGVEKESKDFAAEVMAQIS